MKELIQQLGTIQPMTERDVYYGRTQVMLQALKLGTITLDNLNVTPGGWSLVEIEKPIQPVEESIEKIMESIEKIMDGCN